MINPYCRHGDIHSFCPYSPEQIGFSASPAFECFFGGAAGPGKTVLLLNEGLRQIDRPGYTAVFFRRTMGELDQVAEMSHSTFPEFGGRFNKNEYKWIFPRRPRSAHPQVARGRYQEDGRIGASYLLAYAEREIQRLRFQGRAFAYIAFDELTQWPTPAVYTYLFLRCRPFFQGQDVKCYIRAASNPGGPGHGWVKKRFIMGREDRTLYRQRVRDDLTGKTMIYHRQFIRALLDSNDKMDPQYLVALLAYPDPELRRAMRHGDWDIAAGVMFAELRERLHRIPRRAPLHWTRKVIACDWGYEHFAVAGWFETTSGVSDATPHTVLYQELVVNHTPPELFAQQVVKRSEGTEIDHMVLDSNAWATPQDGGPAPAEKMLPILRAAGIQLRPTSKGAGSRMRGWMLLHTYFYPRRRGGPLLRIMDNCPVTWHQLTTLARGIEPHDIEDLEPHQVDDAADMIRYFAQDRPDPAPPTPDELLMRDEQLDYAIDSASYEVQKIEQLRRLGFPAVRDRPRRN